MKYLIVSGVFVLGIALGYVIGTQYPTVNTVPENGISYDVNESDEKENNKKKNSHHSDDSNDEVSDDAELDMDSTFQDLTLQDSLNEAENISTEKMIRTNQYQIIDLTQEETVDTVMENMLGIDHPQPTSIYVEFWESPLNYEGYKLSRKKMIVYGLSPQFEYTVYKDGGSYYLSYQNIYYKMKETQDFLPFTEVPKSDVFND